MRLCPALALLLLSSSVALAAQAAQQQGYFDLDGGKLYYEVAGQGHPLVLIHGGQLDHRIWDEQFEFFSKRYRVVRYDARGFGNSPRSTKVYADEDDLAALLKHLQIDKAYIVGLSLGGRIAIDFALAHPGMVDAIVPVAPGLSGFNFGNDPNFFATLEASQSGNWEKAADLWLQSGYMAPAMKNPAIAPRLRQWAIENAHQNMDNPFLERILKPPAMERLQEIRVPVLIVVGSLDVTDILEIAGLCYARIPGAQEVVIQNSGHIVNMEQPQQFNSVVLDFLERQKPVKMEKR